MVLLTEQNSLLFIDLHTKKPPKNCFYKGEKCKVLSAAGLVLEELGLEGAEQHLLVQKQEYVCVQCSCTRKCMDKCMYRHTKKLR